MTEAGGVKRRSLWRRFTKWYAWVLSQVLAVALVAMRYAARLPATPELSCFAGWRNALLLRGLPNTFSWRSHSMQAAAMMLGSLGGAGLILAASNSPKPMRRGVLAVILTANIGMMTYVFADYAARLFGWDKGFGWIWAGSAVILLTFLNILGIRAGKLTQNLLTATKVLGHSMTPSARNRREAGIIGFMMRDDDAATPGRSCPAFWSRNRWRHVARAIVLRAARWRD